MKNKYERLSKEEKKQAKLDYIASSEIYANIYKKLRRLIIICIIGIVYAIVNFGIDLFFTNSIIDFILDGGLIIFCVIFILKSNKIISNQINKFLIEQMNEKKK